MEDSKDTSVDVKVGVCDEARHYFQRRIVDLQEELDGLLRAYEKRVRSDGEDKAEDWMRWQMDRYRTGAEL